MFDMIKYYEHVLDRETCTELVRIFNTRPDLHQSKLGPKGFTEFDLSTHRNLFDIHERLVLNQMDLIKRYIADMCIDRTQQFDLDTRFGFENFRIKCYTPGQSFPMHTDEGGNRTLACLYYLNTDFTGGHTHFPHHNTTFVPSAGSVVLFPATWEYLHEGMPVITGNKYLLSSYLVRNATRN